METKIIKSSPAEEPGAAPGPGKIIKKELFQASEEARDIVKAARQEAEKILVRAEQERAASVESGLQIGYEEGLKRWNQILAGAWQTRENLKTEWEQSLLHLAVRIAEKIIGEQLRLHPDTVISIVREALKSVGQERQLTLLVHPDHREMIQANLDRLQAMVGASRQIHLVANADIAPGGCVVESELGVIDAKLETQLKCLEEVLLSASKKSGQSS
ncbi:MAG: type III secretion system stator protein SctL [Acidobacteria bacterium]|nr:type III secretion system stator protein SctL [Acidobacteriota bacterium]